MTVGRQSGRGLWSWLRKKLGKNGCCQDGTCCGRSWNDRGAASECCQPDGECCTAGRTCCTGAGATESACC